MDKGVTYRARLVVPRPGLVIDDGAVVVAGDKVAEVGLYRLLRESAPTETVDLGDVALIPGFVNAHTHLELT